MRRINPTVCRCPRVCIVHGAERRLRAELKRRLKAARRMGYRFTRAELDELASVITPEEREELEELVAGEARAALPDVVEVDERRGVS